MGGAGGGNAGAWPLEAVVRRLARAAEETAEEDAKDAAADAAKSEPEDDLSAPRNRAREGAKKRKTRRASLDKVALLAKMLSNEAAARKERRRERNASSHSEPNARGPPGATKAANEDGNVSALDALSLSQVQLMSMLNVGWEDAREVLHSVASACRPQVQTAAALLTLGGEAIATPLPLFSLAPGHLVEVVGRAGTGKTQFCITTAVDAASRTGRHVVFVDTENKFSAQRVAEVIRARGDGDDMPVDEVARLADKITVFSPRNAKQFERDLDAVELLVAEQDVALVVVDSVAALAERARGAQALSRLAARLKLLGETCQVAVLVTNQVTTGRLQEDDGARGVRGLSSADAFGVAHDEDMYADAQDRFEDGEASSTSGPGPMGGGSRQVHVLAALGNTWAHAVNVRVTFELEVAGLRRASLVKAPHRGDATSYFIISERGVDPARSLLKKAKQASPAGA
ncbi:DNA repair protein RAD51-like 2 [Hondaea fermentalgiana]|uniref:DNA repair protein RAD51-like 2 n=1 Tax=Hondaea fermentalgiana TaxID=2315210 RepID=A0A2R5GDD2_9STRA|nr:DNA repair protein RAD51-like 2 [Hondaea fermentalgiana]|eukprot:GBG25814.1 DNA repair protein RAD51-like 2 [Hondaea fermentalgiana]